MKRQLSIVLVCLLLSLFHVHAQNTVTACQYWIDDGSRAEVTVTNGHTAFTVDASTTAEGLHTLNYRMKDSEGMYSSLQTWVFLRRKDTSTTGRNVTMCQYWIDDGSRTEVTANDGETTFVVDASKFSEGLHTLNYRMKDNEGMYSPLQTWTFLRKAIGQTPTASSVKSLEYWFDDNVAGAKTQPVTNSTISLAADVSGLASGLHTLCYRVSDNLGNYSPAQTWVFLKKEEQIAENRKIVWCKYWWNDHVDKAVTDSLRADSAVFVFEKQLVVPEYAMTDGFSRNSTARFSILFGDDLGHTSPLQAFDVSYPDEQPPVTTITATLNDTGTVATLTWTASEDNIVDYNIYYAEENQSFVLWLPNTTKSTAIFKGQAGKTYCFTVTARDKAGNQEAYDEGKCAIVKFATSN